MPSIALCVPLLFLSLTLFAQDPEVVSVAEHYKTDNAIVWSSTEHLRLKFEDGNLVGRSDISHEVLLLSDQAAGMFNTDEVYHGFHHTLDNIDAVSLQPNGTSYKTIKAAQYKTTHVDEENIFYDDYKQTQVSFTNLSRFARTRLNYSLNHSDVHFLLPFHFQSYIPVRFAEYSVTFPKGVKIGYLLTGLHTEKIKMTQEEGRKDITYTWTVQDMPRVMRYEDAPDMGHSLPHIVIYVKEYEDPRSGENKKILSSVSDLYHYNYRFIRDVDTRANAEMATIVDSLTKGLSDPKVKAMHIYKWVQDHMRYVAYEDSLGGYIPRASSVVCARRFGDCKDMSSVLVAMCRKAGLNGYFAWIGTRSIPYKYEELPSPIDDNHMICLLKLDNKWLVMDGTARNMPFGMPPSAIQGKEALVAIDSNHYEVVPIPVAVAENNSVVDSSHINIHGDDLEGSIATHFAGYQAFHYAAMMLYSSGSDKEKMLKRINSRGSDNYSEKAAAFEAANNPQQDCSITTNFKLPGYVKSVGGETYVNLNLQRTFDDEYVDKAVREVPIEYSYKQHIRQVVSLKIPDGYKLSYIPADKSDGDPQLWSYSFHYEQKGNEIRLIKDFVFNTILVQPEQFTVHNRLVDGIRNEYKEAVVLTKNP